jgi:hypothetical protein
VFEGGGFEGWGEGVEIFLGGWFLEAESYEVEF